MGDSQTHNHLSELDSLLSELHSATANNAHIIRNDEYYREHTHNDSKVGVFKPPLDSLINDLESSIRMNESKNLVRISASYDDNLSGRLPSSNQSGMQYSSNSRLPIHETNLDDVLMANNRKSAPREDDPSQFYDVAVVGDSGENDIYDNTAYATNYFVSEVNRNSTSSGNFNANSSSRNSLERPQPNRSSAQLTGIASREQSRLSNGSVSNSPSFPSNGNFDDCYKAVTDKLASMGVNPINKGMCEKCGMSIHGQIVTAVGKLWHPTCFACILCMKQLAGEDFFERHGEAFCQGCYQQSFAPKCHECSQPILDTFVSALDQNWHPECFVCRRCQLRLGEGEASYHEGTDGNAYCTNCYTSHCAPKCRGSKCGGEPIHSQFITALGGQWHPECFACTDCGVEFAGSGNFFEFEGHPYCEVHYHGHRGSLCHRCSQPIKGRCITAMGGKRFHPEHFICVFCLKQLNKGTFKEYKTQPYCHPCYVRLFGGQY